MLELILLGAILGGFAVVLAYQLTRMLIEKQVNLSDLDAIVKALFELDFDKAFWTKIALGTILGAGGAFLGLGTLTSGVPVGVDTMGLIGYGFAWGFAGNGILYIIKMIPANVFAVLNLNNKINTLKSENQSLKAHVQTLQAMNSTSVNNTPLKQQDNGVATNTQGGVAFSEQDRLVI